MIPAFLLKAIIELRLFCFQLFKNFFSFFAGSYRGVILQGVMRIDWLAGTAWCGWDGMGWVDDADDMVGY